MEARFSTPVQNGPGAHPASCTMCTESFSGVKSGRGVTLSPQPLLVPWSRKSRAIPLLPLWAARPVQSLSACTRVHFTFFYLCLKSVCPAHLVNAVNIRLLNSTSSGTVSRLRSWDLSAIYFPHNCDRLLFSIAFTVGVPLVWYLRHSWFTISVPDTYKIGKSALCLINTIIEQ